MEISINEGSSKVTVNIDGVIKGVTDSQRFKDAIESVQSHKKSIEININESFAITSTIIGYLRKKIQVDKLDISLNVKDARLYELLDELMLAEIFNAKKI
jgi:hypothetical protein